jgi:hypothetical protein
MVSVISSASLFQTKPGGNRRAIARARNDAMQPTDHELREDEPLEAWTPEEFDHFTDLGLLRHDLPDERTG